MKDFALDLNCSVEDVEKVVVLIEGIGVSKYYKGRRQSDNYMYVSVRNSNDRFYVYNEGFPVNRDNPLYQMPQDWDKIQASLGVDVDPIITETSKLRGRLLKKSKRIEELEGINESLVKLNHNQVEQIKSLDYKLTKSYCALDAYYSESDILRGFKAWELDTRVNPSEFKSVEDIKSASIDDNAKECLTALVNFIKE